MAKYRRASYEDQKKIEKLCEQVMIRGDDGYCEYKEGWDDARVAKTIKPYLGPSCTVTVRKMADTPMPLRRGLVPGRTPSVSADLEARITRLERIINKLAADLGVDTETCASERRPVPKANGHLTIDDALDVLLS